MQDGADLEARNEHGWIPLHCAAGVNDNPDVITLLLEHGADVAARSRNGWTLLHYAANANKSDVVARLLELGADGTAKTADVETVWGIAQKNEGLRGTKAWWLLNEIRFE